MRSLAAGSTMAERYTCRTDRETRGQHALLSCCRMLRGSSSVTARYWSQDGLSNLSTQHHLVRMVSDRQFVVGARREELTTPQTHAHTGQARCHDAIKDKMLEPDSDDIKKLRAQDLLSPSVHSAPHLPAIREPTRAQLCR